MGLFLTVVFALAIGLYVYRVVRKSTQNVKAGKCISCDGHCSNDSCDLHIDS